VYAVLAVSNRISLRLLTPLRRANPRSLGVALPQSPVISARHAAGRAGDVAATLDALEGLIAVGETDAAVLRDVRRTTIPSFPIVVRANRKLGRDGNAGPRSPVPELPGVRDRSGRHRHYRFRREPSAPFVGLFRRGCGSVARRRSLLELAGIFAIGKSGVREGSRDTELRRHRRNEPRSEV